MTSETLHSLHLPRWGELPSLALYMDQVVLLLEEALAPFADDKGSVVTSTMVNNYVKQKLLPPPEKKKYGKGQIAPLVVITVLKKVLSINEIHALQTMLEEEYGLEKGYELFCDKLEEALAGAFSEKCAHPVPPKRGDGALFALDAALCALCGRMLLQSCIAEREELEKTTK